MPVSVFIVWLQGDWVRFISFFSLVGDLSLPVDIRVIDYRTSNKEQDYMKDFDDTQSSDNSAMEESDDEDDGDSNGFIDDSVYNRIYSSDSESSSSSDSEENFSAEE